jgi:hypothetical protein
MKTAELRLPVLATLAATRGLLGAGIGLLLADKLSHGQRRAIGFTLAGIGAVSTIPLALKVLGNLRHEGRLLTRSH